MSFAYLIVWSLGTHSIYSMYTLVSKLRCCDELRNSVQEKLCCMELGELGLLTLHERLQQRPSTKQDSSIGRTPSSVLKRKWDTNYDRLGSFEWESLTTAAAKHRDAWIAWQHLKDRRSKQGQRDPKWSHGRKNVHHASSLSPPSKVKTKSRGIESQLTYHTFPENFRAKVCKQSTTIVTFHH